MDLNTLRYWLYKQKKKNNLVFTLKNDIFGRISKYEKRIRDIENVYENRPCAEAGIDAEEKF